MAYREFEEVRDAPPSGATRRARALLGAIERNVIWLSIKDGWASVDGASRLARFGSWLTGLEPKPRLADARLEALRRYAVMYRLNGEMIAPSEELAVARAGFDVAQIREIRLLVARYAARGLRAAHPVVSAALAVLAAPMLAAGATLIIERPTSDVAVGAVIAGLVAVVMIAARRGARY